MHLRIIREVQLAESILGCWQISSCRQLQPVSRSFCVWQQQAAVPVQQSQEVLSVDVTVLRQPFQILCCLISLLQWQLIAFNPGPQP